MAGAQGVLKIEERMLDVKRRYGSYPQAKWEKNLALKRCFAAKAHADIDAVVGE